MSYFYHEDRAFSLANGLLLAAADGTSLQAVTDEERDYIEMIEPFGQLLADEAYSDLLARMSPSARSRGCRAVGTSAELWGPDTACRSDSWTEVG